VSSFGTYAQIERKSVKEVTDWATTVGRLNADAVRRWQEEGQYHGRHLLKLTRDELISLGLPRGPATDIAEAIAELRTELNLPPLAQTLSAAAPNAAIFAAATASAAPPRAPAVVAAIPVCSHL
jgi:hypothetical protein